MALSCDTVAPQLRGCGFLHANIMRIDVQVKSVHDSDIYALRYRVGDQEYCPNTSANACDGTTSAVRRGGYRNWLVRPA